MVQAVPVHACRIPLGQCGQGWGQVQARVAMGGGILGTTSGQRIPSRTAQPFVPWSGRCTCWQHVSSQTSTFLSHGSRTRPRRRRHKAKATHQGQPGPNFPATGNGEAASDSGNWFPIHLAQKAWTAGHPLPQCPRDGLPRAAQSWPFPTLFGKCFLFEGGLLPHQEFTSLVYGSGPESPGHSFGMCQQKYPLRYSLDSDFSFCESQD